MRIETLVFCIKVKSLKCVFSLLVLLISFAVICPEVGKETEQTQQIPTALPTINDFYVTGTNSTGNVTWTGYPGMFSFNISDNMSLDHAIFGCNNTGYWVNNANTSLSGSGPTWDNYTVTFNSSPCTLAFNYTVYNTNPNFSASTGLRIIRLYAYNSSAYAWNTPFQNLATAITTVEAANNWNQVDNYTQTILDQQTSGGAYVSPTTYLENVINSFDSEVWKTAAGNVANGWTNPTNAYDGNTGTAAGYAWNTASETNKLVLNFSSSVSDMARYYVNRNSTAINTMHVYLANQTGPWIEESEVFTPTWGAYANVTFTDGYCQYSAVGITFSQNSATQSNATVYEFNPLNFTVTPSLVLQYSAECNKLGITQKAAINDALADFTMVGNLPFTLLDGSTQTFSPENSWALYGFWYSNNSWSAASSSKKWNITAAYTQFDAAVNYSVTHGTTTGLPLYIYSDSTGKSFTNRYYDEDACTVDCYIIFYTLLNVSDALNKALYWWSYINTIHWTGNTLYSYQGQNGQYECEAAFFLKIISTLKFYYHNLGNWTNVLSDIGNRFLSNDWNSAQWIPSAGNPSTYVVVHDDPENNQRRLTNTFGAWQALLGVYNQLNSTYQSNVRDMLYGNNSFQPAWADILTPDSASFPSTYPHSSGAGLFNASSNLFSWSSADNGYQYVDKDYNATALGEELMIILGIVPGTTTIAFPLEELNYEYTQDVDPALLQLNSTMRELHIPIDRSGIITFQYGTSPTTFNFTKPGVYTVSFSSSWNVITQVALESSLPDNLIYFSQLTPTHDVCISSVTFSDGNPSVNGTVTNNNPLQNNGGNTEHFVVSLNCTLKNVSNVKTQNVKLLSEHTATINFTWTPSVQGLYAVKAYTSEILVDTNPDTTLK